MKFFVTGRSTNYKRVQDAFDEIEKRGHTVTLRWTEHAMIKPYKENQPQAAEYATQQIEGITEADVYILFAHHDGTGVFAEFGAALALAQLRGTPQIYAIGDEELMSQAMFHYHPLVQWRASLDGILSELL